MLFNFAHDVKKSRLRPKLVSITFDSSRFQGGGAIKYSRIYHKRRIRLSPGLNNSGRTPLRTQRERWNRIFNDYGTKRPPYDGWLGKYTDIFNASKETPVIDLGCGSGNNTLYPHEQAYQVIACDFAEAALQRLSHFIPNPVTQLFDLRSRSPLNDGAAKIAGVTSSVSGQC
jgi:hypothetical protein